ncbi:MAG: hypothetical protein Q4F97_08880, partial [Bacteroidales bacterium]|nr:hypothetical protein [Bacteroidales bacterium]
MKNLYYILLILSFTSLFSCNSNSKNKSLYVTKQDVPDSMFREYLTNTYDKNQDGMLSFFECRAIRYLDCEGMRITSLKGIEKMENLQIINCSNNKIKALDLTGCSKVTEIKCFNNELENIVFPKDNKIEKLYCAINKLNS